MPWQPEDPKIPKAKTAKAKRAKTEKKLPSIGSVLMAALARDETLSVEDLAKACAKAGLKQVTIGIGRSYFLKAF